MFLRSLLTFLLSITCLPVFAYIGPGVGAGLVSTVFGILGALILAIVGILYYPIKRLIKKYKKAKPNTLPDDK